MTSSATPIENRFTAWMENPNDPTLPNQIHAADGARQYGFRAALVGGVTIYGWCIPTLLQAVGDTWLDNGWAEVHFRRPTYPGDEVTVRATPGEGDWELLAQNQAGESCVRGSFGLGEAPWLGMLERSQRLQADPIQEGREWLTLQNAPIGSDICTMPLQITLDDARDIVENRLRDTNPLFNGDRPLVHPFSIARNMISLLAYSYDYGKPSIHVSSHIQNLGRIQVGEQLVITGRLVDAYERNGHHYAVTDGAFINEAGREVARVRHTNIIQVAKRETS